MEKGSYRPSYLLTPATEVFLARAAESNERVLLEGETGTGKTLLARLIHERSRRRRGPLVTVGCGAFAASLAEREIFGHVRGAYTGAEQSSEGVIESARGGTLVLNDIDLLPLSHQPKLLDFLDDGGIRRVGNAERRAVDVRVIATTNQPLGVLVAERSFRNDLFHRIAVLRFEMPPLRNRKEDLPELLRLILDDRDSTGLLSGTGDRPIFSKDALRLLMQHSWPGNHREFASVIARILLVHEGGVIGEEQVQNAIGDTPGSWTNESARDRETARTRMKKARYRAPADPDDERRRIVQAMRSAKGVRRAAAESLGMNRQLLWMKIQLHRIREEEWGDSGGFAGETEGLL